MRIEAVDADRVAYLAPDGARYEEVLLAVDEAAGYRGLIAVHSTALGPAVGGTRVWQYASLDQALADVLRLARGMTYKNAAAGLDLGGGKSVIIGDNRFARREEVFRAHGRFVNALGGRYVTAEDVGTSPRDMASVHEETEHVAGLAERSGAPSPVTARGVLRAMRAAARERWGTDDLSGRGVALQGCGSVGAHLARQLAGAGASLTICDVDAGRARRLADELGAAVAAAESIYDVAADIFAPCALGGILNDDTIPRLRVEVVAGAANNQLKERRHGDALEARGILYAPDYIANAGGVINGCRELLGWDADRARRQVDAIYDTMRQVLALARETGMPTHAAADRIAERRLSGTTGIEDAGW